MGWPLAGETLSEVEEHVQFFGDLCDRNGVFWLGRLSSDGSGRAPALT